MATAQADLGETGAALDTVQVGLSRDPSEYDSRNTPPPPLYRRCIVTRNTASEIVEQGLRGGRRTSESKKVRVIRRTPRVAMNVAFSEGLRPVTRWRGSTRFGLFLVFYLNDGAGTCYGTSAQHLFFSNTTPHFRNFIRIFSAMKFKRGLGTQITHF